MGAPPSPSTPEQLSLFGEASVPLVPVGADPVSLPGSVAQAADRLADPRAKGGFRAPQADPSTPRRAPPDPVTRVFRHPRATQELMLQGCRVGFELRRARRRSIGFVIGPEGLAVSAPRWTGSAEIEAALREKAAWIVRKLHEQEERARRLEQARIEWGDGACVPFLGETVIVVLDPRTTGAVLHTDAQGLPGVPRLTLHVGLPQGAAAEQVREAVQGWLQRQARRIFEERCALYAQELGVQVRRLALSSAATRWGSAAADGSVRLNWRLVHFALPVIDYVVAHELAHLRVMDHSPRFWEVVGSVVPDFQAQRAVLHEAVLPPMD